MIPELIHFIWFPPSLLEPAPPGDVLRHVSEWQRLHPNFVIKIWGYDDLQSLRVLEDTNIGKHLPCCRFEAMKSDIARLAIVYEHGGFYSDLKNSPMKSFLDELLPADKALLTEHAPTTPDWKDQIQNSFLAGPPKHEFFRDCLIKIEHKLARRLGHHVGATTGGGILRSVIAARQRSAIEDYRIIPQEQAWRFSSKGTQTGSGWMLRTSASYNGPGLERHWSVRERVEGIYL